MYVCSNVCINMSYNVCTNSITMVLHGWKYSPANFAGLIFSVS